jgi:hypothetical protein
MSGIAFGIGKSPAKPQWRAVRRRTWTYIRRRKTTIAPMVGGAMARKLCTLAAAIAALAALAPAAHAGVLVAEATDCGPQPLERPFVRWLDPFTYTLVSGGSYEGSLSGWNLSGGSETVSVNEPFYVHGAGETKSLRLPAGSSATSAVICVGLGHPTARFFARSSGGSLLSSLQVDVLFETAGGQVLSLPIGVVPAALHRSWQPTLPMPVLANLLALLPGERTPVKFRFTPRGSASWTIDDVYVDPKCR